MNRKYEFYWDLLGDVELGRPNLGPAVRTEVYRLMQFSFRDVLEKHFGTEKTDQLFFEAGRLAGEQFYQNVVTPTDDISDFIKKLQAVLIEKKIGILRIEEGDFIQGRFVLTVTEDLDCSGMPELDYAVCVYDEGFIAGILESFTGKKFNVKEVDCWCTGDRTCRFVAQAYEE